MYPIDRAILENDIIHPIADGKQTNPSITKCQFFRGYGTPTSWRLPNRRQSVETLVPIFWRANLPIDYRHKLIDIVSCVRDRKFHRRSVNNCRQYWIHWYWLSTINYFFVLICLSKLVKFHPCNSLIVN